MVPGSRRRRLILVPVLAVLAFAAVRPAQAWPAAPCSQSHWVGSWTASPSDGGESRAVLADQTLRMIIAPHLGGSILRVHLSNRFGRSPITLGPMTIGARGTGASLIPGSMRALKFSTSNTVTIAPGADAVSDPVKLSFVPFEDLAISVAITGSVPTPTEHYFTRQTSYLTPVGAGDHAGDSSGAAFSQTTQANNDSTGWYFIDGLDVQAPGRVGAVAAFGDSTTDGFQGNVLPVNEQLSTIDTNTRWPDDLQRRLIASGRPLSALNTAIDGNRILQDGMIPSFGPSGISRLHVDALSQAGVRDVIVVEGINDIGMSYPARINVQHLINGYINLINQAHAAGIKIQLATLTPTGGTVPPSYGDSEANQLRQQVNAWIRSQRLSDGVFDFDAAERDPTNPSQLNAVYDGGDHLHFNPAGHQALANAVDLSRLATPACAPPSLKLVVHPSVVEVGRRTLVRVRVISQSGKAGIRGARVVIGRRQLQTGASGSAAIRLLIRHAGRIRISASLPGYRPTRIVIRAIPRRRT